MPNAMTRAARIAELLREPRQWRGIYTVLEAGIVKWYQLRGPSMGAAIAYYTAFSIAPVLVIVIAVAGLMFGRKAASGAIFAQLAGLIGGDGARALETMIAGAASVGDSALAAAIGVALLAFSATTVFGEIQGALNVIWEAPPTRRPPILDLLRTRMASFGLIVSLGFLFLVLMVMNAALAAFSGWLDAIMPGLDALMVVVNLALSLVTTFALFALMYRVLPDIRIPWRDVWFGAAISAALFLIGRWGISTYIATAKLVSTFGAASALVVILVWVYYSAQIFLLGAAIAKVVAERRGQRAVELISKPKASAAEARRAAARR